MFGNPKKCDHSVISGSVLLAPVAIKARAVSTPMPAEHPVIKKTLPLSFPVIPSSLTMSAAVGRASPGPAGLAWAAAYLDDAMLEWCESANFGSNCRTAVGNLGQQEIHMTHACVRAPMLRSEPMQCVSNIFYV